MTKGKELMKKYPERIPVICIANPDIHLEKCKFLVDGNATLASFIIILRKYMMTQVKSYEAIFLFVNDTLIPNSSTFYTMHSEHKNKRDDILYIHLKKELTFG